MGKYRYLKVEPQELKQQNTVHPVWRGIGCFMIILIPILSYAMASVLVDLNIKNHWIVIPAELSRTVFIPLMHKSVPHLYINLALAILIAFMGYGFLVFLYSLIYKFSGPSKYGPYDSPPMH